MSKALNFIHHIDPKSEIVTKCQRKFKDVVIAALKASRIPITDAGFYSVSVYLDGADISATIDYAVEDVVIYIKPDSYENVAEILGAFGKQVIDEKFLREALDNLDDDIENLQFQAKMFNINALSNRKLLDNIVTMSTVNGGEVSIITKGTSINSYIDDLNYSYGIIKTSAPKKINDYVLPEEARILWDGIVAPLEGKLEYVRLYLEGLSGSGKTSFGMKLHEAYQDIADVAFLAMSQVRDTQDMFYRRTLVDGNTKDEMNTLTMELFRDTDRPLIAIYDEITRLSSTEVQNALMQVMGEQRLIEVGGDYYRVKRPVLFICTGNEGSEYVGTDLLDAALDSRFDMVIHMRPPNETIYREIALSYNNEHLDGVIEENDVILVASVIHKMTEHMIDNGMPIRITNREMLNILRLMSTGVTMRLAFTFAIVTKMRHDDVRAAMEAILNSELPL